MNFITGIFDDERAPFGTGEKGNARGFRRRRELEIANDKEGRIIGEDNDTAEESFVRVRGREECKYGILGIPTVIVKSAPDGLRGRERDKIIDGSFFWEDIDRKRKREDKGFGAIEESGFGHDDFVFEFHMLDDELVMPFAAIIRDGTIDHKEKEIAEGRIGESGKRKGFGLMTAEEESRPGIEFLSGTEGKTSDMTFKNGGEIEGKGRDKGMVGNTGREERRGKGGDRRDLKDIRRSERAEENLRSIDGSKKETILRRNG
jgi:hypothetical protein